MMHMKEKEESDLNQFSDTNVIRNRIISESNQSGRNRNIKNSNIKNRKMKSTQRDQKQKRKDSGEKQSVTEVDGPVIEHRDVERIYSMFKAKKDGEWIQEFKKLVQKMDLKESEIEEWKENEVSKHPKFSSLWFEFNKNQNKIRNPLSKINRKLMNSLSTGHTKPKPSKVLVVDNSNPAERRPLHNNSTNSVHNAHIIQLFDSLSHAGSNYTTEDRIDEREECASADLMHIEPLDEEEEDPSSLEDEAELVGKRDGNSIETESAADNCKEEDNGILRLKTLLKVELPFDFPAPDERERRGSFDLLSPTQKEMNGK